MPGLLVCARLGCLTDCLYQGVRRLSPALRCTGVQLRLRCSRPHDGERNAASLMETPTAEVGLKRWPGGHQGRYMGANGMSSHVKGRYKSAQACSLPVQHF